MRAICTTFFAAKPRIDLGPEYPYPVVHPLVKRTKLIRKKREISISCPFLLSSIFYETKIGNPLPSIRLSTKLTWRYLYEILRKNDSSVTLVAKFFVLSLIEAL